MQLRLSDTSLKVWKSLKRLYQYRKVACYLSWIVFKRFIAEQKGGMLLELGSP